MANLGHETQGSGHMALVLDCIQELLNRFTLHFPV